jgi:hypothetical protein
VPEADKKRRKKLTRSEQEELAKVVGKVKLLAKRYYELTECPLGVTAEIGEYEAVRRLPNLRLEPPRRSGHDVTRHRRGKQPYRLQVKTRRILNKKSQQIGAIDIENKEWDGVLLVILDESYDATAIYEVNRKSIEARLREPGSKARERGVLSVSAFKQAAGDKPTWSREAPV